MEKQIRLRAIEIAAMVPWENIDQLISRAIEIEKYVEGYEVMSFDFSGTSTPFGTTEGDNGREF